MTEVLKDWRGRTIEPGCTIIYPARASSSVWLCEATVLEITERLEYGRPKVALSVQKHRQSGFSNASRTFQPSTLTALRNVTVVKAAAK